ncbi:MAG: ABC transporter permease subunit [Desulfurococcaceae archaeon]
MYRWRRIKDKLFFMFIIALSLIAIMPLIHIIIVTLGNGIPVILRAGVDFFTKTPPTPLSRDIGGIAPSLVGSTIMTLIATPLTILLALFSAIMSTEFPRNPLSMAVDVIAKSLASIPTIVVSMVVYLVVVIPMKRFSMIAGAIALTIIALPYAYTYISTYLRSIPATYREAAYAIAMSRWRTVFNVFIPIIRRGLAIGVLMTVARIMGETAALLFVTGRYRIGVSLSPLDPADAIPLLIFDYMLTPYKVFQDISWAAAALLLVSYLVIFISTKFLVKEVKL